MENAYERATPHSLFGENNLPSGFWALLWDPRAPDPRVLARFLASLFGIALRNAPVAVGEKNCPRALWGVRRGLAHARGAIWGISLVFYRGIRRGLGTSRGAIGAPPGARGDAEGHSNRIWPAFCPILFLTVQKYHGLR